jgi:hypothetical protein
MWYFVQHYDPTLDQVPQVSQGQVAQEQEQPGVVVL